MHICILNIYIYDNAAHNSTKKKKSFFYIKRWTRKNNHEFSEPQKEEEKITWNNHNKRFLYIRHTLELTLTLNIECI